MNPKTVYTIVGKELLEMLRDKRTLIAMIGIPLLLYPLLIIVMIQVASVHQSKLEETASRVALLAAPGPTVDAPIEQWIVAIDKVEIVKTDNARQDLSEGQIDALVVTRDDTSAVLAQRGSVRIDIEYDRTESRSRRAMQRVRQALDRQAQDILKQRLATAGLDEQFAQPLAVEEKNVATAKKQAGSVLGSILPMIMIITLGIGAFYPAIDLTAGEKERGTFETLLATPTSKAEIVAGKFFAVFFLAMVAAGLNLASMAGSLAYALSQAPAGAEQPGFNLTNLHLAPGDIVVFLLVLIPLAFFICALMMAVALLARDFKEAQNFVTPFYILILLPAMLVAVPDSKLTATTVFIPVANVALLFKDLLIDQASWEHVFLVFLCTAVYALMALVVAVWLFQREQVILAEEKGLPFTFRRCAFAPRPVPTIGLSLSLFALALLLLFYVASYFQSRQIISGLLITQWVLLLLPTVAILWYVRIDLRRSLSLRLPSPVHVLAAILLAAASLVLVMHANSLQGRVLDMPQDLKDYFAKLIDKDASLALLLVTFALSPAICEEVLFRGAILSGLRTRMPDYVAIIIVGILFGLFHLSIYRLMPTALLGIVITYAALRSRSIFIAMLMHFLVNATLVLADRQALPPPVLKILANPDIETQGFPPWLLAAAASVAVVAIALFQLTRPPNTARTVANGRPI